MIRFRSAADPDPQWRVISKNLPQGLSHLGGARAPSLDDHVLVPAHHAAGNAGVIRILGARWSPLGAGVGFGLGDPGAIHLGGGSVRDLHQTPALTDPKRAVSPAIQHSLYEGLFLEIVQHHGFISPLEFLKNGDVHPMLLHPGHLGQMPVGIGLDDFEHSIDRELFRSPEQAVGQSCASQNKKRDAAPVQDPLGNAGPLPSASVRFEPGDPAGPHLALSPVPTCVPRAAGPAGGHPRRA